MGDSGNVNGILLQLEAGFANAKSGPLVYCMMTGSSCRDVLVLFLLLIPADLQENMLISVRCQTRLHIIGATVVAEETGGVAPRTGKMAQTYGIRGPFLESPDN